MSLLPIVAAACAGAPHYLSGDGPAARQEAALGWGLLITSIVVSLIVTILVLVACLKRRRPGIEMAGSARAGVRWIVIGGLGLPALILVVAFVFTLRTLRAVDAPPRRPAVVVHVIAHQWWWELRYAADSSGVEVATANELHVPLGQPIRLELDAADVIHSFWVPRLAGKTDLIPGQHNVAWLQADRAGVYWGQCAEYCGVQHAHMALRVVAESAATFAAWRAQSAAPAVAMVPNDTIAAGQRVFVTSTCSECHAIRGTAAHGTFGPDLTHVASRLTLASGLLPNTRGNLAGWIANPQTLKPGTTMPTVTLSSEQLLAVVAYLETLR